MKRTPGGLLLKTEYPPPLHGGARVYYHEILRRQQEGRFAVLTGVGGSEDVAFDAAQIYRIERRAFIRPARGPGYAHLVVLLARWLAVTLRMLRRDRGILLLGQMDWTYAFGLIARRLLGTPFVLFLHGEELTQFRRRTTVAARLLRMVTDRAFRRADAMVVNSGFTRDLASGFGVDPERITVIHPGVDSERFCPDPARTAPADPPRLLSVGRLYERKGIDTALAAVKLLREQFPGIRYDVVGEGPDRKRLETIRHELGLEDCVRFLGAVEVSALPGLYREADVFVLPNRELANADTEGFGIVFLEAAASGVPAIAGRAGGTSEAVAEGVTGLRVDPGSPQALAAAVTSLLTDPEVWRRMALAARQRAVEEFSWDRAAGQLADLIARIAPT